VSTAVSSSIGIALNLPGWMSLRLASKLGSDKRHKIDA